MRYRINHRTAFTYASPVHESFNEVRLQPVSGATQTGLDFDLSIDPPATVITFRDYYGNNVHDFGVPYLHDHLTIEATSDVVTFAAADQPLAGPLQGEEDRSPALTALASDPLFADEWAEFLTPSAYITLEQTSGDLARALLAREPGPTAHSFLHHAARYIRETFTYQVGATTVRSTVADLIGGGSGVCQDYAHLLIELCRHVGLPARYVSGYLGDVSASAASHAWTEALVPPYGWLGLDPTLGAPCTGRHVKVSVGRDYADVSPLRGTYRGGGEAALDVTVTAITLDESRELATARTAGEGRGRNRLIQYQTLGAVTKARRLGAMTMTQSLGGMTQTMASVASGEGAMPRQYDEPEVPRQQPQQQQQSGDGGRVAVNASTASTMTGVPAPAGAIENTATVSENGTLLRLGCEFGYDSTWATPAVMLVQPHPDIPSMVRRESWSTEPALPSHLYSDLYGNRCRRFVLPAGETTLSFDALVEVSPEPDEVSLDAIQHPVEELPDDALLYTLASRYCPSDALSATAWHLFGQAPSGWGRVQAVCDWIHANIRYGLHSTPLTTAVDVFVAQGGMCRDFAHLGVTFCRALNIPARYTFGYVPDISLPPPYPTMDFHAWFEVYLSGRWWTFDARFNRPLIGRVPVGRGRDAVDVAMMTTYGAAQFRRMTVWCNAVAAQTAAGIDNATGAEALVTSGDGTAAAVVERPS